ncbi:MAG: carbon starvation protein A [Candidatus Erginobacter occultus]|nr:carbon starvation protein A [Candidatus Erginobacter occultus]
MSALFLAIISIIGFLLAYFLYGRFLQRKIFRLLPDEKIPSRDREDGIDFVPTRGGILFSHHFVSIAGLGPILGPAIGVIWGWLPAMLWVVFGTIFLGAVHDFGTLVISLRNEGRSIGEVVRDLIGYRAGTLMMLVIFFLLALAMGVFAYLVAVLFTDFYPQAVVPVFALMPIAMGVGYLIYRKGTAPWLATAVGVVLMFAMIEVGIRYRVSVYPAFLPAAARQSLRSAGPYPIPDAAGEYFQRIARPDWSSALGAAKTKAVALWVYILLLYAFIASVLPVWFLLQPRDYLNSYQLYLALLLMLAGLAVSGSRVVAPPVHGGMEGMPPLFPFLFITIACGAISGFHNLVSSGTTARQLGKISDARFIGYGAMLLEGLLAVLVILACTATFAGQSEWLARYADYGQMDKLGPKLNVFIEGAGSFIAQLGISRTYAVSFISVMVVAFAMTTLDSGTRLMRYDVEAIGNTFKIRPLKNRYLSSLIGTAAIGYFALMKIDGVAAGLTLWQLFGTTNQLLAALGLLAVSVYLFEIRRPTVYTVVPMVFMLAVALAAMVIKLIEFWAAGNWPLIVTGAGILVLTLWLMGEALVLVRIFWLARREAGRVKGG